MTFTVTSRKPVNMGSMEGAFVDIDITSYAAGGEDVSAAKLGLSAEPLIVIAVPTEKNLNGRVDHANKKLLLFYPLAQHSHALLVTGGQAAGAALQIAPDDGTAVLGKTAATNRTLAEGTPIQNKTAAVGGELAAIDDGGTWRLLCLWA